MPSHHQETPSVIFDPLDRENDPRNLTWAGEAPTGTYPMWSRTKVALGEAAITAISPLTLLVSDTLRSMDRP